MSLPRLCSFSCCESLELCLGGGRDALRLGLDLDGERDCDGVRDRDGDGDGDGDMCHLARDADPGAPSGPARECGEVDADGGRGLCMAAVKVSWTKRRQDARKGPARNPQTMASAATHNKTRGAQEQLRAVYGQVTHPLLVGVLSQHTYRSKL